jgi:hypothetical protein
MHFKRKMATDRIWPCSPTEPVRSRFLVGDRRTFAVDRSTATLFASSPAGSSVTEVNLSTGNVTYVPTGNVTYFPVSSTPQRIDVDQFTGDVSVANAGSGIVSVL